MEIALAEGTPAAFGAGTVCEAFQLTVAARRERVALRTKGDAVSWTWADYGERVRRYAAGLHGLGIGAHDTVALLLVNRPEMNVVDMAAVHVGAVPFSIYATSTVEQMRHLLVDAAARVAVTERGFLPRLREAAAGTRVETIVVVDGVDGADEGAGGAVIDLDALAARAPAGFDFEAAWRAVEARRSC